MGPSELFFLFYFGGICVCMSVLLLLFLKEALMYLRLALNW